MTTCEEGNQELLDDLVDSCVPGDQVKVVGVVKSVETAKISHSS